MLIGGAPAGDEIRGREVNDPVSHFAAIPEVRRRAAPLPARPGRRVAQRRAASAGSSAGGPRRQVRHLPRRPTSGSSSTPTPPRARGGRAREGHADRVRRARPARHLAQGVPARPAAEGQRLDRHDPRSSIDRGHRRHGTPLIARAGGPPRAFVRMREGTARAARDGPGLRVLLTSSRSGDLPACCFRGDVSGLEEPPPLRRIHRGRKPREPPGSPDRRPVPSCARSPSSPAPDASGSPGSPRGG